MSARRPRGRKPRDITAATHRLVDMLTGEVSLVDSPANNRPFLTRKAKTSKFAINPEDRREMLTAVIEALPLITEASSALANASGDDRASVPREVLDRLRLAGELLVECGERMENRRHAS